MNTVKNILILACSFMVLFTAPLAAQQRSAEAATTSDMIAQGALDGRTAAESEGTAGWLAGGFVGGLALGLIGTGLTYALAGSSGVDVRTAEFSAQKRESEPYTRSYHEAYRDKLKDKRKSSALIGGVAGTATLVLLILSGS